MYESDENEKCEDDNINEINFEDRRANNETIITLNASYTSGNIAFLYLQLY